MAMISPINIVKEENNKLVITVGTIAEAAGVADYTCDGTDDNVQIQTALDALPVTGGQIVVLTGTYSFSATVTRAIGNVSIEGAGAGTYFTNDGLTDLFTAGGDNWTFSNLRTDAGGLNMGATTGYLWTNVTIDTQLYTYYAPTVGIGSVYDMTVGAGNLTAATGRTATYVIAASDAPAHVKAQADYVCDGTADNVEIQAAIDALTVGRLVVDIVKLVGGFTISTTIEIPSYTELDLTEAKITLDDLSDTHMIKNSDHVGGNTHIYITGGILDGNKAGQTVEAFSYTKYGIFLQTCTFSEIEETFIYDVCEYGIELSKCEDCKINNTDTNSCGLTGGDGIEVSESTNCTVINCHSNDNASSGVQLEGCNGCSVIGGSMSGNEYGVEVNNQIAGTMLNIVNGVSISDCVLGVFVRAGIDGATIISNQIKMSSDSSHGIYVLQGEAQGAFNGNNIKISDNYIYGVGNSTGNKYGILTTSANALYSINSVLITDNFIDYVGNMGIRLYRTHYGIVDGNFINNCVNNGDGAAVVIDGDSSYNTISNNKYYSNDRFCVSVKNDAGVGNIITNNDFRNNTWVAPQIAKECVIYNNQGYIAPSELRTASGTLTAGATNATCFYWHNPEAQDVYIKKVVITVTTPGGTAGSGLQVGISDDAAGTNLGTEFANTFDLNTAAVYDSTLATDNGTQTKWVFCQDSASATDGWVVGKILVANASSLVGSYYVEYVGK
jgi:parallel beta-helix repeat protein